MSRPPVVGQVFGPLRSGYDVEQGALTVLRAALPIWLYEAERQQGLNQGTLTQPPSPMESYIGGVDFENYDRDQTPAVIVVVKPDGEADNSNDAGFTQQYTLRIGAVVYAETEDETRRLAWLYGAAIQNVIENYGDLDGVVERTRLRTAAAVSLEDPENYLVLTVAVEFDTWLTGVASDNTGPGVFPPQNSLEYPGETYLPWPEWPVVGDYNVAVEAQPLNDDPAEQ